MAAELDSRPLVIHLWRITLTEGPRVRVVLHAALGRRVNVGSRGAECETGSLAEE